MADLHLRWRGCRVQRSPGIGVVVMADTTPLKAIRELCRWCVHDDKEAIRECAGTTCPIHPLRMGRGVKGISAMKSIRAKCRDCGEGTHDDVLKCAFPDCSLYPYRMGRNPKLAGRGAGIPRNTDHLRRATQQRPPKPVTGTTSRASTAHEMPNPSTDRGT